MAEVRFSIEPKGDRMEWTLHILECFHRRVLQLEIPEDPAWMRLNRLEALRNLWLEGQTCDCRVDRAIAALERAMAARWQELPEAERVSYYRWPELEGIELCTTPHVSMSEPVNRSPAS